ALQSVRHDPEYPGRRRGLKKAMRAFAVNCLVVWSERNGKVIGSYWTHKSDTVMNANGEETGAEATWRRAGSTAGARRAQRRRCPRNKSRNAVHTRQRSCRG